MARTMIKKPESEFRDPLIDEVRERRRKLWRKHGGDLARFCRAARELNVSVAGTKRADRPQSRTARAKKMSRVKS